jgi:hypothetical protein
MIKIRNGDKSAPAIEVTVANVVMIPGYIEEKYEKPADDQRAYVRFLASATVSISIAAIYPVSGRHHAWIVRGALTV